MQENTTNKGMMKKFDKDKSKDAVKKREEIKELRRGKLERNNGEKEGD